MKDEQRDPDLEWIRSHWKAPQPSASLATRVLASYRSQIGATRRRRWLWWVPIPITVAAVLTFLTLSKPSATEYYRPVAEPRFIVVSQGERP